MRVTVAGGYPESDQGLCGRHQPAACADDRAVAVPAAGLAAEFARLPLSHTDGNIISPRMDDGAITVVVFAFTDRDDVDLWVKTSDYQTVANGFILTANDGTVTP